MPAYNFQTQFVEAIETGSKFSTIRKARRDGRLPKVGERLFLYTGMRTAACRLIAQKLCLGVRRITIDFEIASGLIVDGRRQSAADSAWYARRDGFKDFSDMLRWFRDQHGLPFSGLLIEW